MGKGGVGKTTVAAALAWAHAARGHRVGLASLTGAAEVAELLRDAGGTPERLALLDVDPRRILDDAVQRLVPMPALTQLLTHHPAYDAVYRIVPGVREMALLHRLVEHTEESFDVIVVDGLATGHGTHFLDAPRKTAHLLAGKLAERARVIEATLTDPARAEVLLTSTLEEMPVHETLALAAALRERGFALRAVVANRVSEPRVRSAEGMALLQRLGERDLARAVASEVGASWTTVRRGARAALHVERRARGKAPRMAELRSLGVPLVALSLLPEKGRVQAAAEQLASLTELRGAAP